MGWARIDDGFDDHPKVMALLENDEGGAAVGLWTLCLTWAHRNTRKAGKVPGMIPASLPRRYLGPGARDLAKLLVAEGLWDDRAEGDGWMIHDFDQYLPKAETSEARAEAGRRGAAKRWGNKRGGSKEPEGDGNLPSDDGALPGLSYDADGQPIANDGSRAPARRVIPNGITPEPAPDPVPPTAGANKPRRRLPPAEAAERQRHVGEVVAAFADGATGAGQRNPPAALRSRVGRQAKELLAEDWPIDFLIDSARRMGAGQFSDLAIQARKDEAAAKGCDTTPSKPRQSTTDRAVNEAQALKARLAASRNQESA